MKTLITVADRELKRLAFNRAALDKLSAISDIEWVPEGEPFGIEDLAGRIGDFDACITSWGSPKLTPEVLARAERLKFIGHAAGTVVPIVHPDVFHTDIVVANANICLAKSTAELALTLMLAGAWRIKDFAAGFQRGVWSNNNGQTVMGLHRQTIGLIGYGEISREVVRLLQPFAADIRMFSRHCTEAEAAELGVRLCSLDELMSSCRIISLHNTLTPESRGMIGKHELKLMQDGALLVNTARGPIVDEADLLAELQTGRIRAALDVYEVEPLPKEHPLLKLEHVICLPHIGGFCDYWKTRLGERIVDQLIAWKNGDSVSGQITLEKYNRLTPR